MKRILENKTGINSISTGRHFHFLLNWQSLSDEWGNGPRCCLTSQLNRVALWLHSLGTPKCRPQNGIICDTWGPIRNGNAQLHQKQLNYSPRRWPAVWSPKHSRWLPVPLFREYRQASQTQKPWKIKIWIKDRTDTALCSPYPVSWFQRTRADWPAPLAHKASFLGNPHQRASWIWRPRDLFQGTLRKTPSLREAHSQAFL